MVKAIILDVDGVIVGDQPGVNFPLPHAEVIQKLREIHANGVPIILCTAKYGFAIQGIIKQAGLNNPHITDGGALIIDPIDDVIVKKHVISSGVVQEIAERCLEAGVLVEAYTPDAYYVQRSQVAVFSDFMVKRVEVLQQEPVVVDSLLETVKSKDTIKLLAFAKDTDKPPVDEIVQTLGNKVSFIWTVNQHLSPFRPGIVTATNVSKRHASEEAIKSLDLSFDDVLGAGDTVSDWNFMELCGYAATLANGDDQIKAFVQTKGRGKYFIAPHVNDNGILGIFEHFNLS